MATTFEVTSRIRHILEVYAELYHGTEEDKVKTLAAEGKYALAYYKMTQANQQVSLALKPTTFFSPHENFFSAGCDKWEMDANKKIPWWLMDKAAILKHVESNDDILKALNKEGGRRSNPSQAWSKYSFEKGIFLHEEMGPVILNNACLDEAIRRDFKTIIPGRMFNPNYGFFGCTADGITVKSALDFEELYQELMISDPSLPMSPRLKSLIEEGQGVPIYCHEIKTLHTVKISSDQVYNLAQKDCHYVIQFLEKLFKEAKWTSSSIMNRNCNIILKDAKMHKKRFKKPLRIVSKEANNYWKNSVLNSSGPGAVILYDPTDYSGKGILRRFEFKDFPFKIGPSSNAFCQIMTQAATVGFMNRSMKYIYTCVISFSSDGPVRPACQLSFDLALDPFFIEAYQRFCVEKIPLWEKYIFLEGHEINIKTDAESPSKKRKLF